MPFDFTCPFCHTRTRVDDKFAGQTGPCVNCTKTITLPSSSPASGSSVHSPGQAPSVAPKLQSAKRNLLPAIVALFILAGVISATLIAGIFATPYLKKTMILADQRRDLIQMQKVALALNNYADRYGTYPPPTIYDSAGHPLYSWRVLILPFLGYETQYRTFELDQPFDSPANLQAAANMPSEFLSTDNSNSLAHTSGQSNYSNYVLLTGPGTLFPPEGPMGHQGIDPSTLLLVETNNQGLSWTEPGNMNISHGARPGTRPLKDLGGISPDSFVVVCTDGKGLIISNSVAGSLIDALISPKGGEMVDLTPHLVFE